MTTINHAEDAASDPAAYAYARKRVGKAQDLAAEQFEGLRRRPRGASGEMPPEHRRRRHGGAGRDAGGLSAKQIAELHGLEGQDWERYYRRRLQDCLATLARLYGFAG